MFEGLKNHLHGVSWPQWSSLFVKLEMLVSGGIGWQDGFL